MEIDIFWSRARKLYDGSRSNLIYNIDLSEIPEDPGLYLFSREHGRSKHILYVGQALNLQRRIKQQLNNTRLMKGIQNAPAGYRMLVIGRIATKPGQKIKRCLDIAEKALIRSMLGDGHDLLNVSGTAIDPHFITSHRLEYTSQIPKTLAYEEIK